MNKTIKFITFIFSIGIVFYGESLATDLVVAAMEKLGPYEALNTTSYKIVPYVIFYFFIAAIIPSILLKLTKQPKKSIVTLTMSGVLYALTSYYSLQETDGIDVAKYNMKIVVGIAIAFILAVAFTAIINVKFRRNEPETF